MPGITTLTTPTLLPPHTAGLGLPPAPLRQGALRAAALAGLVVCAAGLALHISFGTTVSQPVFAVVVFTTIAAVALVSIGDSHPYPRFGVANHVTLSRAVLVALAASLIVEPASASLDWVLVVATVTVVALDGVDGWLARRTGMASAFGARFDMETDAFFMLVLSALVWRHDKAGAWVMSIGLMRYAFVAAGWRLTWLAQPLRSTTRGKMAAVLTLAALGVSLAPPVPPSMSTPICAAALTWLAASFVTDVRYLWRRRAAAPTLQRTHPAGSARDRASHRAEDARA